MPQVCSGDSVRTTWRCRSAGSSTPSGSTSAAGSKPTSPSRARPKIRYLIVTSCATPDARFRLAVPRTSPMTRAPSPSMCPRRMRSLASWGRAAASCCRPSPMPISRPPLSFRTSRLIDLGYARVRASRITYVGELGWELYIPTEFAQSVYDVIIDGRRARPDCGFAGYHALNRLRIEKAYRHWGHDIGDEDTPLEAGLAFAVAWNKPGASSAARRCCGSGRRASGAGWWRWPSRYGSAPLSQRTDLAEHGRARRPHHLRESFGHTVAAALGLGYLENRESPASDEWVAAGRTRSRSPGSV